MSYESADTRTTNSTLTVRDAIDEARREVPSDRWAFGTCTSGETSLVASSYDICVFDGLEQYREDLPIDKVDDVDNREESEGIAGIGAADVLGCM